MNFSKILDAIVLEEDYIKEIIFLVTLLMKIMKKITTTFTHMKMNLFIYQNIWLNH